MYLVHMHSDRGTILSLRFPIGTTLEYVRDWYDSRVASGAFRKLHITRVSYERI